MKKLIIYIIVLAIIIGLGIAVGLNMEDERKTVPTSTEKIDNKVENNVENKVENKIDNTVENNVVENETDDQVIENENPDKSGKPKTDLDKAIDLVKEEWGTENGVYFAQDGKTDEGEYIICVRDSRTTNALAWYKVNIETGTCEEW